MASKKQQKLELTWIGKGEEPTLEPRILIENPEYSYGDSDSDNMLIHGDNLLALKALEQDYAGKVKCIYIDPPYNTGTAFEVYDDGLEHSIWLGLMNQRLKLLRNLLSEDGLLWISIDDNESAYLQVLCDTIFGRKNFIACLPTIMNLKGNQDQFGFAGTHEYTLVYAKDKEKCNLNKFPIDEEEMEKWDEDEIGYFKKGATLRATGAESTRYDRIKMFYPILEKNGNIETVTNSEFENLYNNDKKEFNDTFLTELKSKYEALGYNIILPKVDSENYGRWRWGFSDENRHRMTYDVIPVYTKNGISLYKKQRPELGELPSKKPKTIFYKPEYSSGNGTGQIKKLFGKNNFPYPKPEDLIRDIIHLSTNVNDLILDSFLGSGTTSAVAQKMGRKFIGIEMGEHAYTHCFPRQKMVTDGEDQGGITEAVNWQGGGGFKFYELAPSLLNKDQYDNWVISKEYNANMLAAAMAKQEGFSYSPNTDNYWKQGFSSEQDFIYTTTQFVTVELLDQLHDQLQEGDSLLICAKKFQPECANRFGNISLKKIPQMLLGKCEFAKDDYSLNIINLPQEDDINETEEDLENE